eukprot:GHVU01122799.1.p1 GENE.GHVU01122799.1~~GHVU01122799.1.p1  ORF type:complete len:317 (-),score=24.68 GHVU01122799.1:1689-2639(-)
MSIVNYARVLSYIISFFVVVLADSYLRRVGLLPRQGATSDVPVSDTPVGITLASVCSRKHFQWVPQLIDSIRWQTRQADEVLIVLSTKYPDEALQNTVRFLLNQPLELRINVQVRVGAFLAGQNRQFALSYAHNDVVSYIDCNDLLHPQRNEVVLGMFLRHPDINALLHLSVGWNANATAEFDYSTLPQILTNDSSTFDLPPPYETHQQQDPIIRWNTTWDASEPYSEPNSNFGSNVGGGSVIRWFPRNSKSTSDPAFATNGHMTVRKSAAVTDVPFSCNSVRENSLYNWRPLRMGKDVACFSQPLSVYVRRRVKW